MTKRTVSVSKKQLETAKNEVCEAADYWLTEVKNYTDINLLRLDNAVQELRRLKASKTGRK